MAAPVPDIGHLAELHFDASNTGGTNYTEIVKVVSIDAPGEESDEVETTDLKDTVVQTVSAIVSDNGELNFTAYFEANNTQPNLFYTARSTGATGKFKVVWPHSSTVAQEFSGWVKKIKPNPIEKKSPLTHTVTVRVTSAITFS